MSPRNNSGLRNAGGNRTDVPRPAVRQAGQPNGRPSAALLPTGLPYGEKSQLTNAISSAPRIKGRPIPPPATSEDFTKGPGNDRLRQVLANRPARPPVPGLLDPAAPGENIMSGAVGQSDSVLGSPQPGGVAPLLAQVAAMTGSAALSHLATQAQANGV